MSQDDSSPLTRDIAPFGVRMPPDLKERVAAAAKMNNRSMNAEIVATLEEKYPAPVDPTLELLIRRVMEAMDALPPPERQEVLRELPQRIRKQVPNASPALEEGIIKIITAVVETAPTDD